MTFYKWLSCVNNRFFSACFRFTWRIIIFYVLFNDGCLLHIVERYFSFIFIQIFFSFIKNNESLAFNQNIDRNDIDNFFCQFSYIYFVLTGFRRHYRHRITNLKRNRDLENRTNTFCYICDRAGDQYNAAKQMQAF